MTYSDEFFTWIDEHLAEDPTKLRLRYAAKKGTESAIDIPLAIMQVESRRKHSAKFPNTLRRCSRFVFPTSLSAEQATGDRLAEWHASLINPGERIIDLTAGLGIDDMHIANRASTVTSIERSPELVDALNHNCKCSGISNLTPICADCRDYIKTLPSDSFDTVFIDPARRADDGSRVYDIAQCEPDVIDMLPELRRIARRLVVKLSPMLDIAHTVNSLPGTTDIYAIGTTTECKELVVVVGLRNEVTFEPHIHAVTLTPDNHASEIVFTRNEELAANATYGNIQPSDTLLEPFPAVMKTAPFKLLPERYGVKAISANSHLYFIGKNETTPDETSKGESTFPGRAYKVEKVLPYASSVIKRLRKEYPRINITTRNFPVAAPILRKKLSVTDGDPNTSPRLLATTDLTSNPIMIITKPKW